MKKKGPIFRGYIQSLKIRWPLDIVTLGLAALAAGLAGIFSWVAAASMQRYFAE